MLPYVVFVWLLIGISSTLWLRKKGAWTAFIGGVVLTLYGALPSIGLSIDGQTLQNINMQFSGQFLLLFFSVLGGGIISSAWAELRTISRQPNASQG